MTQTTDPLTGATIEAPPRTDPTGLRASTGAPHGDDVKEGARALASEGRAQAGEVARDAAEHARALLGSASSELKTHASDQTRRLAAGLRDVHQQLDGLARGEAPTGMVSDVTAQLSSFASRNADRLEHDGIDGVVRDLASFARRRPAVFLLGAVVAGAVVGRLLRATDTRALLDAARGEPTDGRGVPEGGDEASVTATASIFTDPTATGGVAGASDLSGLGPQEGTVPGYPEGSTAHRGA